MTTTNVLSQELLTQAAFLRDREPVYERLLHLLEEAIHGDFGARLSELWAARTFVASYERPLLLLAALRYDVLSEGLTHPLYRALSDDSAQAGALTATAFAEALSPERTRFARVLRERTVQTNETTRAVTWLWPAHLLSSVRHVGTVALVDLGASAGLNLVGDDLPALWTDEHGNQIPTEPRPPIGLRLGLDLSPLDVKQADDARWLRACIWPSDRQRLERLMQGIQAFEARSARPDAPVLEACPLPSAPARLAVLPAGMFVLCMQTIVRDYLTPDELERYDSGLREFLRRRPLRSVVAELELEPGSTDVSDRKAAIVLRFATPEGEVRELLVARTHPHPRRLFVQQKAVDEFLAAFGSGILNRTP